MTVGDRDVDRCDPAGSGDPHGLDFAAQVSAISALNEPVRRALYGYVLGQTDAVGRDEAAKAVGISRVLAAFHLERLLEQGLLEVEYRRLSGKEGPGAGRPAKLYRPSDRQLEITLPGRRYELAARLMAEAFSQQGADPAKALDDVARRFGEQLGTRARRRLGRRPNHSRLLQTTCDVLRDHGFQPTEVDGVVRLRNCPFHSLAQAHAELVCAMNLSMARGILGGLRAGGLEARLDPQPGQCCVVLSMAQGSEAADQRAIEPVGGEGGERRPPAVVEHHESRRFEKSLGVDAAERTAHAGVDHRQEDVHQGAAAEHAVDQTESRAEEPAGPAHRPEDGVVTEGEEEPEEEMEEVAQRLGPEAVGGDHRAQEEGQIDAGHPELTGRPQNGGQDERADEPPGQRAP
jgi:predicted ArsR family transcriptional regulator